jgi:hypothetical protein
MSQPTKRWVCNICGTKIKPTSCPDGLCVHCRGRKLYHKRVVNKGWFKKGVPHPTYGQHPKTEWKLGQHVSPQTEFKKGHRPWNKGGR